MSTDFFFKKLLAHMLAVGFIVFLLSLSFYSLYFQSAKRVGVSLRYYYLVRMDITTEAGAIAVYNEGGASYFLQDGKREWLALAVYTNKSDADSVLENLASTSKEVDIVEKGVSALYFKGSHKKAMADTYVNGLQLFDGYIQALEECIYCLDNGISQEKAKGLLQILHRQLGYTAEVYKKDFKGLSKACTQAKNGLEPICRSVIMAKDLRYLACEMAEANISLTKEFLL